MLTCLASFGIPFGGSKFSYYEALHFGSSVLENHDDTFEGIYINVDGFIFMYLHVNAGTFACKV